MRSLAVSAIELRRLRESSASSKRQSHIGAVCCDIRLMLDKIDIGDNIQQK